MPVSDYVREWWKEKFKVATLISLLALTIAASTCYVNYWYTKDSLVIRFDRGFVEAAQADNGDTPAGDNLEIPFVLVNEGNQNAAIQTLDFGVSRDMNKTGGRLFDVIAPLDLKGSAHQDVRSLRAVLSLRQLVNLDSGYLFVSIIARDSKGEPYGLQYETIGKITVTPVKGVGTHARVEWSSISLELLDPSKKIRM